MIGLLATILLCLILIIFILWGLTYVEDEKARRVLTFALIALVVVYLVLALAGWAPRIPWGQP